MDEVQLSQLREELNRIAAETMRKALVKLVLIFGTINGINNNRIRNESRNNRPA